MKLQPLSWVEGKCDSDTSCIDSILVASELIRLAFLDKVEPPNEAPYYSYRLLFREAIKTLLMNRSKRYHPRGREAPKSAARVAKGEHT